MIKKSSLIKVNLYISEKQLNDLKERAAIQSLSYAALIRIAINNYLAKKV